ncbi:MAG: hypothetical protein AMS17_18965 [Spirochaetes bacterium DG_61]|nr:MAG: hypothetical protein AMS17_18965 [Spirochaetes bacterium DG_61]
MQKETFAILILIGRPAAGKSELIEYLKSIEKYRRMQRFHIGDFELIDDFPMLWSWFEEDRILSDMGKPRLHTTPQGYFKEPYLWDLLIQRICLEYKKRIEKNPLYHEKFTSIIEFSRGKEYGGYAHAFKQLSSEILKAAAVFYIRVSWEESLRKNRRRFNPQRQDSILEHSLPDEKMKRLYRECDWESLSAPDPNYLHIGSIIVPYAVLENEDDVTTKDGEVLGRRLETVLSRLWELYKMKKL